MRSFLWLLACLAITSADLYLHNPRGSNNRLNEQSANRKNANRMFDSQNNNRGGYNFGDSTSNAAGNENQQYRMEYFMSGPYMRYTDAEGNPTGEGQSLLNIEWTNQHGCGGDEDTDPHKTNCLLVMQFMCQDDVPSATGTDDTIRNGQNTGTQQHNRIQNLNEGQGSANNRKNVVASNRGLHEPWQWYDKCYNRERNMGLFTADQNLQTNNGNGYSSAIYTRQNPQGTQRGYECPEERDYYPYWHPTPWRDVALLVQNVSECSKLQAESFNVQQYYECVEYYGNGQRKHWSRYNNQADCEANNGEWLAFTGYLETAQEFGTESACNAANNNQDSVKYIWGRPEDGLALQCLVALNPPDCLQAPWTRDNHLGNTRTGENAQYTMTLPYFPSGKAKRCAFRMRYNISTDDYDPANTDASHNQNYQTGEISPIQNNPNVDVGADSVPLRLAVNTAQYGRVFQDRSHAFKIVPRPNREGIESAKIVNLNVRGKRGNIVQVYPAIEYDFTPTRLEINEGDMIHIQWTGSNTHNNGNPAGDGQAGDAGEGRGGTDRNNIVQIPSALDNYPLPFDRTTMWQNANIVWIHSQADSETQPPPDFSAVDLAVSMASSGYYQCMSAATCGGQSAQNKNKINNLLDNAPASYKGALLQIPAGEYHYMCTRNNNFTNRSQKGMLIVKETNNAKKK
ncbi:protein DD3-3-like [Anneissia japonica]|uniref:protein DD3-3-like n=1 Tax=Anneissia japonica TaxID=1529436 RepID=UPI001425ABFF|nr:protein DD3-3-like [Anneissia japonica]